MGDVSFGACEIFVSWFRTGLYFSEMRSYLRCLFKDANQIVVSIGPFTG